MKTIKTSILMLFAVAFLASCGDKDGGCKTCEATLATIVTIQEVCDVDGDSYTVLTTVDGVTSDSTQTFQTSMSAYITSLELAGYTCE
ncbi:hypothetical protein N9B82_06140 [Saprospiraceae bacterium]|nr:hypothetical protein [Saprospiraceae bacterium]